MFCSARCLVHAVRTHHLQEARLELGRLFPGQEAATLLPNQYLLALRLGLAGGGAGWRGSQQYGAGGWHQQVDTPITQSKYLYCLHVRCGARG